MNFFKNKCLFIPILVVITFILVGISRVLGGIVILAETMYLAYYLFKKNKKTRRFSKPLKVLIGIPLVFMFMAGVGLGFAPDKKEDVKLSAQKNVAKKEIKEDDKKIKEEEEKRKAEEERLKIEEEKKKAEEEKLQEEQKKKEEEQKLQEEEKKRLEEEAKKRELEEKQKVQEEKNAKVQEASKSSYAGNSNSNSSKNNNVNSGNQNTMVWLPKNRGKYHSKPNCGNMDAKNATQVSLEKAKASYGPCSKCRPPR